jgi:hypothetical protein
MDRTTELMQHQRSATYSLALQRAKRTVEWQLRAQGEKISHYSHRELVQLAEAELERNRHELIAWAKPIVEQWTREGMFGKRAQRAFGANLTTNAQKENEPNSTTSTVQILGA